jgi:hypothetical protein
MDHRGRGVARRDGTTVSAAGFGTALGGLSMCIGSYPLVAEDAGAARTWRYVRSRQLGEQDGSRRIRTRLTYIYRRGRARLGPVATRYAGRGTYPVVKQRVDVVVGPRHCDTGRILAAARALSGRVGRTSGYAHG